MDYFLIGRNDAAFSAVFGEPLLESTRRSHRPAPERGLPHPNPVAHLCNEARLCPSRKPLCGPLIGADVTQPRGLVVFDQVIHSGLFRVSPLVALSGLTDTSAVCPLSGAKRTEPLSVALSASKADIAWVEIPRGSLLPYPRHAILSVGSTGGTWQ